MDIVILGCGNVGTHLALALKKAEHNILQIYNRTIESAEKLAHLIGADATDRVQDINKWADIFLITVKDEAINEIAANLVIGDKVVLHTSGSTDISILAKYFTHYGVLYPLQTISKEVELDFSKVPLIVEFSDKQTRELIVNFVFKLSPLIYEYTSEQRRCLHLGAVLSCNFSNYLYTIAHEFLNEKGVDFNLIRPLIKETSDKIQGHNPADVQTGPAIRHDLSIITMHLDLLEKQPHWQRVYAVLTEGIIKHIKA